MAEVVTLPASSLALSANVPDFDRTDDIWATASSKFHTSGRIYVSFGGPKRAQIYIGSTPSKTYDFVAHGTDVDQLWEDDAQNAGSFIPQDSMETLNFQGRWFSNEGNALDFKWKTGAAAPLEIHWSISCSFWFLPHTNGGAFVSDPKVDGQCIYSVVDDTLFAEFLGVYWNNSKIFIQGNNGTFTSSTLTVGQYHHVAFYFHFGGSTGNSSTKIVIDGVHEVDADLGSLIFVTPDDNVDSCNMYVGAKNLSGDNKYLGYLSLLGFDDPDEADISQFPHGSINTHPVAQWWNGAVLDYPDQGEWWGRAWGMDSLTTNGAIYLPCDDATYPPQDLGGTGDLTLTKPQGVGNPTMQVASFADAPGCMSLAGESITLEFDVGLPADANKSGWSHQANESGFPNHIMTVSFWFRWKENGTLPNLAGIFLASWNRISTDSDNFRVLLDPSTQQLSGYFGSFDNGLNVSCVPDRWHYFTAQLITSNTSNQFYWGINNEAGGVGSYNIENAKFKVYDFRISNNWGTNYVDLDLAHIQWNTTEDVINAYAKRSDPDTYYSLGNRVDAIVAAPSYRSYAGVTYAYRDASFWLNQNYWSCQIGSDNDWINEGTSPGSATRAEAFGTLNYLQNNGIVYGCPYTVGIANSHLGNGVRFYYTSSTIGYAPAMWIKFTAWTTGAQTTIAYGPSEAEDGPGLPWANWFLEREAGTNRIRSRMTTISGRGFHYPMELTTAWVDVGLDEWNFIAFGEYTCNNCSPPSDSKIQMSVNGVLYNSNVWPGVFNNNYPAIEWIIGSDVAVTDGFSADINCVFTVYTWDNTTHVLPAYLDGKPDTSLVQAMGGDLFNFISKVNSATTTLDYVLRPGTPSVFGYQPNTTGVTARDEEGPVGSFDWAAEMASTPKWIEVSDPTWGSAGTNVNILECAFKTSGHSGTGTFKMMCTNKNINGVYALGLLHDNTTDTVKLFWTDASDTEYTSTASVAWPQNQYNHLIINRAADLTNDRVDLYLNGVLAITESNIQSGFTPEYAGVFGGGYFGCVSGTCPTNTWISHTGFKMDSGWGITELGNLGDHYAAYVLGDNPSGDQGEDNQCNLGRSDDHSHLALWTRPLTVDSKPADGTILETSAPIPITTQAITWDATELHWSDLPSTNIFLNTFDPIVDSPNPSDVNLPAASIPFTAYSGSWFASDHHFSDLSASSVLIVPIGNTWFSSIIELVNIPSSNIPIDLLDPTVDVEENHFIRMKSSYVPLDPRSTRVNVTEDHWSDLSTPNLPLVANGNSWSATEDRISNIQTSQLDLTPNAIEALSTELHWSNLGSQNLPINTQEVEWTPSRSTDRREIWRAESQLTQGPEISMGISQKQEITLSPRTQKWTSGLAQRFDMAGELARTAQYTLPVVEGDQSVMINSEVAQTVGIDADIATDIKHTLNASIAIRFNMNISTNQGFTSASKMAFVMQL